MSIAEEDLNLLREVIAKLAESTLGTITSRKTNWTASITMKVNHLAETVVEVRDTMQVETYGVDSIDTLAMPVLLSSLRIEMPAYGFPIEEA